MLTGVSDSEDSSSAGSIPSTPSRQSVCSENEGAKHHTTDGNLADTAEQPGTQDGHEEHAEDAYTSEPTAEKKDEPEPDVAESIAMTKQDEEETGHGENEDGPGEGGDEEHSEEFKEEPEVTIQQTDGSRPPGFLYKVSVCFS